MRDYSLSILSSIWFSGLSGSGKTTISKELKILIEEKTNTGVVLLDGDELVELFSSNTVDRSEDARVERVNKYLSLVEILLKTPNIIPIVVMINHSQKLRNMIKGSPKSGHYFEVFVNTSLATCQKRDPKGHYAKANKTDIPNMIGIDLPFDTPSTPDIEISEKLSPKQSAKLIFEQLIQDGVFTI